MPRAGHMWVTIPEVMMHEIGFHAVYVHENMCWCGAGCDLCIASYCGDKVQPKCSDEDPHT